jgi:hypothetical protein
VTSGQHWDGCQPVIPEADAPPATRRAGSVGPERCVRTGRDGPLAPVRMTAAGVAVETVGGCRGASACGTDAAAGFAAADSWAAADAAGLLGRGGSEGAAVPAPMNCG